MDHDDENRDSDYVRQSRTNRPVAALVPERVRAGVLATTAIVTQGANEVVIDFIARLARPDQVVARVVLAKAVYARVVAALEENVGLYESRFGELPSGLSRSSQTSSREESSGEGPAPTSASSIEEIYEELKFPESLHSGAFANAVTIGHTHAEFWLDFITNFFPRAAVSARVYVAAGQMRRLLNTLLAQSVD